QPRELITYRTPVYKGAFILNEFFSKPFRTLSKQVFNLADLWTLTCPCVKDTISQDFLVNWFCFRMRLREKRIIRFFVDCNSRIKSPDVLRCPNEFNNSVDTKAKCGKRPFPSRIRNSDNPCSGLCRTRLNFW